MSIGKRSNLGTIQENLRFEKKAMRTAPGLARIIKFVDDERARQGLSGRELSERSGLGVTTVNRIINGESAPGLDTLEAIAQALGYTLESMLVVGMKTSRKLRETEQLASIVEELQQADRDAVIALARYLKNRQASAG